MGKNRRRPGKKQPRRRGGTSDDANEVLNLIGSVSENDISKLSCEIPSNEEMDKEHFPSPYVEVPSIKWLSNNLLIGCGEWGSALNDLLQEDGDKGLVDFEDDNFDNFSSFSEERQSAYRKRLIEAVRRTRRVTMYKKWVYVKERVEKDAREEAWNQTPWSESDYNNVDMSGVGESPGMNQERKGDIEAEELDEVVI